MLVGLSVNRKTPILQSAYLSSFFQCNSLNKTHTVCSMTLQVIKAVLNCPIVSKARPVLKRETKKRDFLTLCILHIFDITKKIIFFSAFTEWSVIYDNKTETIADKVVEL